MIFQRTITYSVQRSMHTVNVLCNKYLPRQGKFLNKIMHRDTPKKKWYPERMSKPAQFIVTQEKVVNPHVSRRVIVLNKLFMTHITGMMATGEIASSLVGLGIEVTKVEVSIQFNFVKVLWFTTRTSVEEIDQITKILHDQAYRLRHELSQLRVIGIVPPIIFVKDKKAAALVDLNIKLAIAEYGEDFVPTVKTPVQPELKLFTKLPEDVRQKILETEADLKEIPEELDESIYDVDLPPMRQDVLNLNHGVIMSKIKQALNKTRVAKNPMNLQPEIQKPFDQTQSMALRTPEEVEAFENFLRNRHKEEKLLQKWTVESAEARFDFDSEFDSELKHEDSLEDFSDFSEDEYEKPEP